MSVGPNLLFGVAVVDTYGFVLQKNGVYIVMVGVTMEMQSYVGILTRYEMTIYHLPDMSVERRVGL